jgi:hypothetical protein
MSSGESSPYNNRYATEKGNRSMTTMTKRKLLTSEQRLMSALRKGMRVTRRTAIDNGWCENLTATISNLRQKGHTIEPFVGVDDNGKNYTRYKLVA